MLRKSRSALLLVALAALLSAACSTNSVGLSYVPSSPPQAVPGAKARVSVGDFTDDRGEPARWLGAIRGGFGNPVKTLESADPVSEVVEEAFRQALIARGFHAQNGRFVLSGSIGRLDGDQYARKEANVELEVVLTDRQTGREILRRPASANEVAGSAMTLKTGVFASVEDLRVVIERALSDSVEAFVDSSAFRDAVK